MCDLPVPDRNRYDARHLRAAARREWSNKESSTHCPPAEVRGPPDGGGGETGAMPPAHSRLAASDASCAPGPRFA